VLAGALSVLVLLGTSARAADEQKIKDTIERGVGWLKGLQNDQGEWPHDSRESGMTSLAALTLLECGVPADNPAIQRAAGFIRGKAINETRTYSVALAIMFLDRLGEEVDVALIEALGVRLLSGQYSDGGWTYESGAEMPAQQSSRLSEMVRNRVGEGPGGRKAPENDKPPRSRSDLSESTQRELEAILKRGPLSIDGTIGGRAAVMSDNSNTQFAILGLWTARRYGVPVEDALRRIEDRFRRTQNPDDGGWGYRMLVNPNAPKGNIFTPRSSAAMTCAGLLGLAMYHVSAGENALRAGPKGKDGDAKRDSDAKPPRDITDDAAVKAGLMALGKVLNTPPPSREDASGKGHMPGPFQPPRGGGRPGFPPEGAGSRPPEGFQPPGKAPPGKPLPGKPEDKPDKPPLDRPPGGAGFRPPPAGFPDFMVRINQNNAPRFYYFLWSLERVAVAYSLPTIGGKDWYNWGANILIANQEKDGSWQGHSTHGAADTCFGLLFLRRADLARDLSASLRGKFKDQHELRGGVGFKPGQLTKGIRSPFENDNASETDPPKTTAKPPRETTSPTRTRPTPATPVNVDPEVARLGDELIKATPSKWQKALQKLRDGKGPEFTQALAYTITQLDGQQKKSARDALAERLSNMKSSTLGQYLADENPELRRAAALACAMKEDKAHIGKLIDLLDDPERTVERAAYAALKDLSKEDYGPAADASAADKAAAIKTWRAWWKRQAEK
jgi:hypothetical protein